MMNFIGVLFCLVIGWWGGEYVKAKVIEKCSKGYEFTVEGQKFQCHKATFAATIKSLAGQEGQDK